MNVIYTYLPGNVMHVWASAAGESVALLTFLYNQHISTRGTKQEHTVAPKTQVR